MRNGSKGCLSVADKLPGNTFKEKKKLNVTSLSQLMKGKVWNNTAGTFLQEPMSSNTMQKDIVKVGEVRRRVQDAMGDFDVTDREMWADSQVNRKLRKVWRRFVKYRNHVQNLNRKYEVVLMFTKKVSFDDDVGRLHADVKKHAAKMREFAEQIHPVGAIKKVPEDVCLAKSVQGYERKEELTQMPGVPNGELPSGVPREIPLQQSYRQVLRQEPNVICDDKSKKYGVEVDDDMDPDKNIAMTVPTGEVFNIAVAPDDQAVSVVRDKELERLYKAYVAGITALLEYVVKPTKVDHEDLDKSDIDSVVSSPPDVGSLLEDLRVVEESFSASSVGTLGASDPMNLSWCAIWFTDGCILRSRRGWSI